MTQDLLVGVDGGGTKCIVRVEDREGHVIGQATAGAANIRISVDASWQAILSALTSILTSHSIVAPSLHAGMGLAGCEIAEAYQAFTQSSHVFKSLMVTSDAHVACLGAHAGCDGAVIIAGTGVIGYQIEQGTTKRLGGWGFPHDDTGGGAWLGLHAVQCTLRALDGRATSSSLTEAVYTRFQHDQAQLVAWANRANSTAFAELAPLVIQHAEQGDETARTILQQAGNAIDEIGSGLSPHLPCALVGGVGASLQSYLGATLSARLRPALATPVEGAVLLIRDGLAKTRG